jgi:ParB/RepB/Spo0J family partition protein
MEARIGRGPLAGDSNKTMTRAKPAEGASMTAFDNDKNVSVTFVPNGKVGAVEPAGASTSATLQTTPVPKKRPRRKPSAVVAVKEVTPSASPPGEPPGGAPNKAPLRAGTPDPSTDTHLQSWTIPLASIDAAGSPFRFRRKLRADPGIRALAASIEGERLLHPLVVRKVGEAFQLVSGFRRHTALAFLARTKGNDPKAIPVKVSVLPPGTSDDQALEVSFAENLARKTLDSTEKAIAVLKLRDEFGKTMEEIGTLLKLTARQLDRCSEVLSAPDDVRVAFREGKFALRHAVAMARISDPNARSLLIQRSGVKSLRVNTMATVAALPSALLGANGETVVPKEVRAFVRLGATGNYERPFRLTVRLQSQDAVKRVLRYLGRFAA